METIIYTMVRGADWAEAERLGHYAGSADDLRDGFLHFSMAGQLRASAAKHRAGETGLVLVAVEAAALGRGAALRAGGIAAWVVPASAWRVPIAAVRSVQPLPLGADGLHRFPAAIP